MNQDMKDIKTNSKPTKSISDMSRSRTSTKLNRDDEYK